MNQRSAFEAGDSYHRTTFDLGREEDPVILVDPIPAAGQPQSDAPPFNIIAIQQSGCVSCLSGDLSTRRWTANSQGFGESLGISDSSIPQVLYAVIVDAASLKNGFLKAHPDIVSQLQPAVNDDRATLKQTYILCSVIRQTSKHSNRTSKLQYRMHIVQQPSSVSVIGPTLRCLADWQLPNGTSLEHREFALDVKTGILQQISKHAMTVFDLAKAIPADSGRINHAEADFTGTVHLKGPLVMLSTLQHCSIYNMRYQTELDRCNTSLSSSGIHSRKRKRSAPAPSLGSIRIIQYFPKSKIAVGLSATQIVTFNIRLEERQSKHRHGRSSLLAYSLGQKPLQDEVAKQHGTSAVPKSEIDEKEVDEKWSAFALRINKAVDSNNHERFDTAFRETVIEDPTLTNTETAKRVSYTLSKIFGWHRKQRNSRTPKTHRLHLMRIPPATFEWLVQRSSITSQEVQKSLRWFINPSCPIPSTSPEDLVDSLSQYDQTLAQLCTWIEMQPNPEIRGLVHALEGLLHSFDTADPVREDRLITDGREQADEDVESELEAEEDAAQQDLEVASTFLEDGLHARAHAIRTCLDKLSTSFHPSVVSSALKTGMERRHIILLIELLRIDLTEGGWSSSILDFYPMTSANDKVGDAIVAVCALLNCAVDALGGGGWLAGSYGPENDYDTAEAFVSALRNDTSAILEGVQESTFFTGFLKDFLRFERTLKSAPRSARLSSKRSKHAQYELEYASTEAKLPLGLKSVRPVASTRVADGGEIRKRSARDIGQEHGRRLGTYSFDTVRV